MGMSRLMRTLGAVGVAGYLWPLHAAEGVGFVPIQGTVCDCSLVHNRVSLELMTASGAVEISTRDATVRWASPDYAKLVGDVYKIAGPCPPPGEQARVTRCRGCATNTVEAIELGPGASGPAYQDRSSSLWLFKQYIDMVAAGARELRTHEEADTHLFAVSMVVAQHNRVDGGTRSVWIRDRLDDALLTYMTVDRAENMFGRFGGDRRELLKAVQKSHSIRLQYGSRRGLVKSLPYMPMNPMDAPFVGAWGAFTLNIYVEGNNGALRWLGP